MEPVEKHWDNGLYGYPAGKERRMTPFLLACIHITGNKNTASNPDARKGARDEWSFAKRKSPPSAHYYVARDGFALEAIDPEKFAAWSNGDVNEPNLDNLGVKRAVKLLEQRRNPNEAYWLEFECVGFGRRHRITSEQKQTVASVIADYAKRHGLPINRETVHAHADINSVSRRSCPTGAGRRGMFLADVIARANAILNPPAVAPVAPQGEPMITVTDDTPLEVDVRAGAIITDLNGVQIETVQQQGPRRSPFGVLGARAVITASNVLGLVKEADIVEDRVVPNASDEDLEAAKAEGHAAGFQEARARAAEVAVDAIQAI